jgi:CYTH domain-containing protein
MEIERKWRLDKLPDCCTEIFKSQIEQGYIFDGDVELRLRKITKLVENPPWGFPLSDTNTYYITVKGDGNLVRPEWDSEIPQWVYDGLWNKVDHTLRKNRYTIAHNILNGTNTTIKLEFDEYQFQLIGLIILECEFETTQKAEEFVLPYWIGNAIEVTNNPLYKNKTLAKFTSLDHLFTKKD